MKHNFFPVVIITVFTSAVTVLAVNSFSKDKSALQSSDINKSQIPASYASYSPDNVGATYAAPVDFQQAAESSVKAVVHIKTTVNSKTILARDPFAEFFGDDRLRQYRTPEQMGAGSGVVISPDGYIVTNNHVVSGADVVSVTFNDRKTTQAKVIGTDPSTDLAVLKIDEENLPYIEFGNSDNVHLGQWVLAVGYPLTLDATVTAGIVSAKGRSLGINNRNSRTAIESFIQTDAAVNPGNSGGPLVNTNGQLIGINSAIASPTGSFAGYSYAIPSNIVKKATADIIQFGAVQRGYLGIEPRDFKTANPQEIKSYKMDEIQGVFVASVSDKGGAKVAGIQKGDFIKSINNVSVNTIPQLNEQLSRYKPGDHISVVYWRNGKLLTTQVELRNIYGTTSIIKDKSITSSLGASFKVLSSEDKNRFDIKNGVIVTDVGTGVLAKANVSNGFIITGVNGNPIKDVESLERANTNNSMVQIEGFYPNKSGMYYYNIQGGRY